MKGQTSQVKGALMKIEKQIVKVRSNVQVFLNEF